MSAWLVYATNSLMMMNNFLIRLFRVGTLQRRVIQTHSILLLGVRHGRDEPKAYNCAQEVDGYYANIRMGDYMYSHTFACG